MIRFLVAISFLPSFRGDIAVIAIASDHLSPFVRHMGAHGRHPLQRVKGLPALSVLTSIYHLGFGRGLGHSVLRERDPNDVPGEVYHGLLITRLNPANAMEVETVMCHDTMSLTTSSVI
jgi:hypothetical protein